MARVGRNDPCPCGSGKKYKKCCADRDLATPGADDRSLLHERDGRIVSEIMTWAARRFGDAFAPFADFPYEIDPNGPDVALFAPWSAYEYFVGDRRVVDHYLAERGAALLPAERAWIEAQARGWLSAWEMINVDPGAGVRAQDMLTGETRSVREVKGSRQLVEGQVMLARVVEADGVSIFAGIHPRPLPPEAAVRFVLAARSALGAGSGGSTDKESRIPVARLRQPGASQIIIAQWQEALEALRAAGS